MRGEAAAIESCEASSCFSARSCARWVSSLSSWTFSRRTATFSATTPVSRTATTAIQTTPPATPRRARGLRLGAGLGFGRDRGRGEGSAGAASLQEAMALLVPATLDRCAQPGLVAADANREVRRAGTALLARAQEALDDSVLQRMEADDGKPAAGPQHLERLRQRVLERAELVVDRDPEGLEDALGGMAL